MPWYAICKEKCKLGNVEILSNKEYRVQKVGAYAVKIYDVERVGESADAIRLGEKPYMLLGNISAKQYFDKPFWRTE